MNPPVSTHIEDTELSKVANIWRKNDNVIVANRENAKTTTKTDL